MTEFDFEDFCQNHICWRCRYQSDYCNPLGDCNAGYERKFFQLFNSIRISQKAEKAIYDFDEYDDSSELQNLLLFYEEQEKATESLINHILKAVAA